MEVKQNSRRCDLKTFVLVSDIHFPYQDKKALEAFKTFHINKHIDYIILNGDILDFYDVSKYDKNPDRINSLQKELNLAYSFMEDLRYSHPESSIVFIQGNHENRLERYLKKHPELYSLDALKLPNILRLRELNIRYIKDEFKLGPLLITHGSIVRKYSGYSANAELTKNDCSGISGHTHRLNAFYKKTPTRYLSWYESGCLCDIEPEYIHKPDWSQGFIYGIFNRDSYSVLPIPISKGKIRIPEYKEKK